MHNVALFISVVDILVAETTFLLILLLPCRQPTTLWPLLPPRVSPFFLLSFSDFTKNEILSTGGIECGGDETRPTTFGFGIQRSTTKLRAQAIIRAF